MESDHETADTIRALVERTYSAMSTPGSDIASLFAAEDMAAAGSGQGELFYGAQVGAVGEAIASSGMTWVVDEVKVWERGDVAWAQILGHVVVVLDGSPEEVPYWTTGVFGRAPQGWEWLYWGGSEPQEDPRV